MRYPIISIILGLATVGPASAYEKTILSRCEGRLEDDVYNEVRRRYETKRFSYSIEVSAVENTGTTTYEIISNEGKGPVKYTDYQFDTILPSDPRFRSEDYAILDLLRLFRIPQYRVKQILLARSSRNPYVLPTFMIVRGYDREADLGIILIGPALDPAYCRPKK